MAKSKTKAPAEEPVGEAETEEPTAAPRVRLPDPVVVTFDVPALIVEGAPTRSRVDVARFTKRQSKALRALFDGLVADGAEVRRAGMGPVERQADVIRWLLDQVAVQLGIE